MAYDFGRCVYFMYSNTDRNNAISRKNELRNSSRLIPSKPRLQHSCCKKIEAIKEAERQGVELPAKAYKGRPSYAEKAKKLGIYDDITDWKYMYRGENPMCTNFVFAEAIKSKFELFRECKHHNNLIKIIDGVEDWRIAYNFIEYKDVQLYAMNYLFNRVKHGRREEVDKDGKYYEIGVKDRDVMTYVELVHNFEGWYSTNEKSCSEETVDTLNNIEAGLKELGGDTDG